MYSILVLLYKRATQGLIVIAAIICFTSCEVYIPEASGSDYIDLKSPPFFPTKKHIPNDNKLSKEGIELGRYLFYDGRLSGYTEAEKQMSCASCHKQEYAFEGGLNYSHPTPHSMLPLFNLAFNTNNYLWSASTDSLELLILNTLIDSNEINANTDSIVARLSETELYPPMFEAAFGSKKINITNVCKALAQFIRTLVSSDSKFDRYVRGEEQLSDEELKGYILFTTEEGADCFHCHGGGGNMLFSTYLNANNGLDPNQTKEYRIPSLRNIEYTAPYMHDGRFKTIDEVIDQYSENVQYSPSISPLMHHVSESGVQLTPDEKQCLKAFLLTLSDSVFLNNPAYSKPSDKRLP